VPFTGDVPVACACGSPQWRAPVLFAIAVYRLRAPVVYSRAAALPIVEVGSLATRWCGREEYPLPTCRPATCLLPGMFSLSLAVRLALL